MSNKTLEQEIDAAALKFSKQYDSQYQETASIDFEAGAFWLLKNLHLLSPSDVAKIECVSELIDSLNCDNTSLCDHAVEALSNFEPKKEGAE